jgi:hypothetical protein
MEQKQKETEKVVILHGFTHEQIYAIVKATHHMLGNDVDVAFATTTEHSLQMKLQDVIADVSEEHAYMKDHPPGSDTPPK